MVVVIDDPEIGPEEDNVFGKETDERCKHLIGDEPPFTCAIHDRPWYSETPCASHTQIEHGNTECRMGRYMLDNRELLDSFLKRASEYA
jgi:hypothetical protein